MDKVIAFGDSFTWGTDMSDTFRNDLAKPEDRKYGKEYNQTYFRYTWQAVEYIINVKRW